ncbi:MAG: lysylphosphatidylglycerol synthase transmembrane domain-containing protein [Rhodospirillaceae bacterium]
MTKKWLAIGLKAAVSGALIWYLLSGIDMTALGRHLAAMNVAMLALAALVVLVQIAIGGLRWASVLKGLGVELLIPAAARLFYIGAFFNQALPGGAGGDAVRMYMVYRQGVSLRTAINGVIVERVATVLALFALVDVTQPLFVQSLAPEAAKLSTTGVIMVTLASLTGLAVVSQLDRLPESLRRWRVVRGLANLGVDTRAVLFSPGRAVLPLFWCVVGHLNVSLCVFVLAKGLGLAVTLLDCVVLIPPVLLILAVPVSIGGWGVREGAMVWAFALIGVPKEAALVLSLLFGFTALACALPGGLIWLASRAKAGGDGVLPSGRKRGAPRK